VSIREIRVKKLRAFANSAAAARIPSWFEFIRRPRLLGHFCQAGFAGGWFWHEKPLRFRAGPAGAAATSAVRRDIFVEP